MDKILLITEKKEYNESLIDCLRSLFPECKIEIHTKNPAVNYCLSPKKDSADKGTLDKGINGPKSLL